MMTKEKRGFASILPQRTQRFHGGSQRNSIYFSANLSETFVNFAVRRKRSSLTTIRLILLFEFVLLFSNCISSSAQEYIYPLNRDMETRIISFINADTTGFHTAFKPYTINDLKAIAPLDSVWQPIVGDSKFYKTWVGRKLRKEHLLEVNEKEDGFLMSVDPVFNFQIGKDQKASRNVFVNTKGVLVNASVYNKFFFYTQFHENQARYVNYVDSFVNLYEVVPGQGRVKFNPDEVFDFSQATGGIAYTLNKHFDFQFAHDKFFIGDGYRSLLLSDNAYNYPFLRINMTYWKFRYTVIYAVLLDLVSPHDPDVGFYKKYSTTHYLDLNIGKKNKLSFGIFETVMWEPAASRGYELAYLNPIIFLRPVENSLDSPDNILLGLNGKWKVNRHNMLYGQIMLDEFILAEVKAGNGWWGNKQGLQGGFKSSDLFGIKNLNFQTEYNFVRPYTYQHRSESQNYTHHNQALAHPLGANFVESMTFINYRWNNFFAEIKIQFAKNAKDTANLNFGNDIFKSYVDHGPEYGHYMFDGLSGKLNSVDLKINYMVNPKTNFVVELGTVFRKYTNAFSDDRSQLFYFGIRTALENYYFDF